MIKIIKSEKFKKEEGKYLSKLTRTQKEDYNKKVKDFENNEKPVHERLCTHSLKWDLSTFCSFTCCEKDWRSDRIIFTVKNDIINFYDIEEAEFHRVGDHDTYQKLKKSL